MTFYIIHGIGGHSGIHWQKWLKNELEKENISILMPNMPNSNHPDRAEWLDKIKSDLKDISLENLVIVGHSLGVTSALDFLEQIDQKIFGLVCVSGFSVDYGAELNSYFLKSKNIDFSKVRQNVNHSIVIYGNDDPYVSQSALSSVAKGLGIEPFIIDNGGHLNSDAGFTEFPLLLKLIKQKIINS